MDRVSATKCAFRHETCAAPVPAGIHHEFLAPFVNKVRRPREHGLRLPGLRLRCRGGQPVEPADVQLPPS